ncbi:hypothetical protein RND81_10G037800 [Saponaria officinalis]|uniref:Replication protein A 70 kDa DNA-binding subunit B/D first OB fold domain-containing protein n=1 Tax=Saponaria officinalis TaxID=3572 RepID=A0AAW1HY57_SAPOF
MWDNITWIKKVFLGIDIILADEKGHYIQAFIKKDALTYYRDKLKEGQMYIIKNFEVTKNKPTYRCVSNNLMINFIFATSLQPLDDDDPNVPQQVFDLVSYDTIKLRADKDIQLIDLIGRLKKLGKLETINGRKGKVLRRVIEVEIKSGDIITINLWSEVAKSLDDHLPSNKSTTMVLILTSLTTKTFNGNITLGSTDQTRIFSDIRLPEITDYIKGRHNKTLVLHFLPTGKLSEETNTRRREVKM